MSSVAQAAGSSPRTGVDDAHGIGVLGSTGAGIHEMLNLRREMDIVTGTFGHALGGGAGGFVSGKRPVVAWLRQKSRPYLVSTALAPAAAGAALKAIELLRAEPKLREQLFENVRAVREGLAAEGLKVAGGEHAALAVMIGDAVATQRMADLLYRRGIFAMGFCHPVVPEGSARLRVQVTAKHSQRSIDSAVAAFGAAARELGLTRAPRPEPALR